MPKSLTVEQCYDGLQRNGHKIEMPKDDEPQVVSILLNGNVGLKCWSYIDYLVNHKRHMLNRNKPIKKNRRKNR